MHLHGLLVQRASDTLFVSAYFTARGPLIIHGITELGRWMGARVTCCRAGQVELLRAACNAGVLHGGMKQPVRRAPALTRWNGGCQP
eukprot:3451921-Prymnesium_polylepis.1